MAADPLELRRMTADRAMADAVLGFSTVGLDGAVDAGPHRARASRVPGSLVSHGYRWRLADEWTGVWWPQGIAVGEHSGIPIALVSWYAQPKRGVQRGARISVVDLRDPERPTYRHVLLVEARATDAGVVFDPVHAHAGGIAWSGDRLLVAATFDGIREFRLSDILRADRGTRGPFGYDFVLPQSSHHRPVDAKEKGRMRYSFITVETGEGVAIPGGGLSIVAGEYHADSAHRVARLAVSTDRSLVAETHVPGVSRMQGAALHNGEWFVSASRGEKNGGDLWSGPVDALDRHSGALPRGPEALAIWPDRNELWSVSEVRGKRWIFAIDLSRL